MRRKMFILLSVSGIFGLAIFGTTWMVVQELQAGHENVPKQGGPNQHFLPVVAHPEVYYVSGSGNDGNPGTLDQPWKHIQYAVDHVQPGALIYIRGGTYPEGVSITHSGTEDEPIILANYAFEWVSIQGNSEPAISGYAADWVLQGLSLDSSASRTLWLEGIQRWQIRANRIAGAVYIDGDHNLFQDNIVDGSQHAGNPNGVMDNGYNDGSYHNLFIGNTVHDFAARGFWSANGAHDNSFIDNHVYNIFGSSGACIDLDAAYDVTYRNVVAGNVVHDCGLLGIELENSFETLIENNLVYNTGAEGVEVINYDGCEVGGEDGQYGSPDGDCRGVILNTILRQNIIYNAGTTGGIVCYGSAGVQVKGNTVYGGESAALYLDDDVEYCHTWDVRGNIFSNHDRAEISVFNPASLVLDDYNLLFHPGIYDAYQVFGGSSGFYDLAEWRSLTGLAAHSIESDPLFVHPAGHNFHLQAASPAVDQGIDPGTPTDFDGVPRPQGSGYDMGAYER